MTLHDDDFIKFEKEIVKHKEKSHESSMFFYCFLMEL